VYQKAKDSHEQTCIPTTPKKPQQPATTPTKPQQIHNFTQEKTDYIDEENIKQCFYDMDMPALLKHIYFNPQHPENHTVRPVPDDPDALEYHQGGKWIRAPKDDILEDMIRYNGIRLLKSYMRKFSSILLYDPKNDRNPPPKGYAVIADIHDWMLMIQRKKRRYLDSIKTDLMTAFVEI